MTIVSGHSKGAVIVAMFLGLVFTSPQVLADSDQTIKYAIEEEAANTPELQGKDVRVAVEDGSVILFGSVRLYLHKMLYELIAWQTVGVAEVDNEIHVVPQAPLSDAAIERKIREIVKRHQQFDASEIKVTVKRGTVLLDGTFDHPQDVIFLKKRVATIEGVIAIEIDVAFMV
jgi:osmotically-inducible protein OsmY